MHSELQALCILTEQCSRKAIYNLGSFYISLSPLPNITFKYIRLLSL